MQDPIEDRTRELHYLRLVEDVVEFGNGDCSRIDRERVAKAWFCGMSVKQCGEYELAMQNTPAGNRNE